MPTNVDGLLLEQQQQWQQLLLVLHTNNFVRETLPLFVGDLHLIFSLLFLPVVFSIFAQNMMTTILATEISENGSKKRKSGQNFAKSKAKPSSTKKVLVETRLLNLSKYMPPRYHKYKDLCKTLMKN
uniref:Uncharacterized protein n=1 Tax=Glossina brevipalpis TaxID=37001 RepID=A0A1A9WMG9_9MUSC